MRAMCITASFSNRKRAVREPKGALEVFLANQAVIGRWVGEGRQRIPFARPDSQENRTDAFCAH